MVKDENELKKKVKDLSKKYKSIGKAEFVRSGSVVLDAILGGGIPRGVFISWSAENGCGKSTGALHVSRTYCMQNKRVLYLDYEGGVNENQLESMGLTQYLYDPDTNPDGLFYLYQVQTYKDAETILDEIMSDVDLVIIDSVTAILTEKVKGASSEDILPGIDSRVMSTFLKKYKADAVRNGTSWLMINQMRTKIAMGFGQQTHDDEAGGNALKFYPDIRLIMKKAFKGTLERDEETATGKQKVPFGAICTIWAVKNRYERPKIPLNLTILYGKGIDNNFAYADFLTNKGCIVKNGAWFNIKMDGHEDKVNGMSRVIDWISAHKDDVRSYINSQGGYKLLMNSAQATNIDIDNLDEDVYTEDLVDGDFNESDEIRETEDE